MGKIYVLRNWGKTMFIHTRLSAPQSFTMFGRRTRTKRSAKLESDRPYSPAVYGETLQNEWIMLLREVVFFLIARITFQTYHIFCVGKSLFSQWRTSLVYYANCPWVPGVHSHDSWSRPPQDIEIAKNFVDTQLQGCTRNWHFTAGLIAERWGSSDRKESSENNSMTYAKHLNK